MSKVPADQSPIRLDKWLWAARFYKTRSLASDAIAGGKVHVNGQRAKSSKTVSVGDEIRLRTGFDERYIIVKVISPHRGSATVAATLYEETQESLDKRMEQKELRRLNALAIPVPAYKPTKKDRRQLDKLRGK